MKYANEHSDLFRQCKLGGVSLPCWALPIAITLAFSCLGNNAAIGQCLDGEFNRSVELLWINLNWKAGDIHLHAEPSYGLASTREISGPPSI